MRCKRDDVFFLTGIRNNKKKEKIYTGNKKDKDRKERNEIYRNIPRGEGGWGVGKRGKRKIERETVRVVPMELLRVRAPVQDHTHRRGGVDDLPRVVGVPHAVAGVRETTAVNVFQRQLVARR